MLLKGVGKNVIDALQSFVDVLPAIFI